jgi:pimeloyl-ACP methyl ester carboxylesterase
MMSIRAEMIAVDEGQLYVERAGAGEALVFLHAGIADCRMWDEQFAFFAADYHVLRYDLRGFGRSSVPVSPFTHSADLLHLLDHLGIARVHVIACSNGGRVALEFALRYPDRLHSLILSAPAVRGYEFSEQVAQYAASNDAALEAGDHELATELDMKMWVEGPKRRPERLDPQFRARAREMALAVYQLPLYDPALEQPLHPPMINRLWQITCPTLVLAGEYDAPDFLNIAGMVAFAVEKGEKALIPDAGHLLPMERPQVFNQHVQAFLQKQQP